MTVYTNKEFQGYWPVGASAVVFAEDAQQAAERLNEKLRGMNLPPTARAEDMIPFPGSGETVRILNDGDY